MNTNGEISNNTNTKSGMKNSKIIINIENFKNNIINNNTIKIQKNLTNNNIAVNNSINKYIDYEINNLEYHKALQFDKRTYIQYYFSLLKTKHLIIFTFYTKNDYNSRVIKVILFLFSFSLYLTVNALFFSDSTMHKIYEDKGSFDFFYQIPKILCSTIIISLINTIINYFSLTEKEFIEFKNGKKENENFDKKKSKLLKFLNIKFIVFYILTFTFLILFWYYLSCFSAVYKNTQIHLLKDTLISFGLSVIYPFGLNLLPGIFRIPSLKTKNRNCIYRFSKIIQLF